MRKTSIDNTGHHTCLMSTRFLNLGTSASFLSILTASLASSGFSISNVADGRSLINGPICFTVLSGILRIHKLRTLFMTMVKLEMIDVEVGDD